MTILKARITILLLKLADHTATTAAARLYIRKAHEYERDINWL